MIAREISVVIPTKNRPQLLQRCLEAVLAQECDSPFEVVVVNDAGCSIGRVIARDPRVRGIDGPGWGPAAARNAGIASATGAIILFTDDDAIPQPGWIRAVLAALDRTPEAVGVVGAVTSPPFDPLYEHSVRSEGAVGNFLTCNAAYRREALIRIGGFDEQFPFPACEDRDLGYRMQRIGTVLYDASMLVVHPPRPVGIADAVRRGRFLASEWRLSTQHPQTRPPRWSPKWGPFIRIVRGWQRLLTEERVIAGSPRRGIRFAAMALGQIAVALWTTLRGQSNAGTPTAPKPRGANAALRIAWVGPVPDPGGGAAGCAWHVVAGLSRLGCEIDCFVEGAHELLPPELSALPGVRVINFDTGWRYNRWYSNHRTTKVFTGFGARAWGRHRLATLLGEQHRAHPYDVVYQFSTIELFGLRRLLRDLPPLVLHPSTHAAGELRGLRAERELAAKCEPLWRRASTEALLVFRAAKQKRDIHSANRVLALSARFGEHLVTDYGVDPGRIIVVPNPIDLHELAATHQPAHAPRRVAFVSRMSVRKGVDAIVALSHRLADLEGAVVLELVGAETLWSDYRPLLAGLHPGVATYHGPMQRAELVRFLADVDMLIQPAIFEPFGLVVGEALACGVSVVATNEVGAAENVSPQCCIVVPAGDIDALEKGVREMLDRLDGDALALRHTARSEAERLFAPETIAELVMDALVTAAALHGVGNA